MLVAFHFKHFIPYLSVSQWCWWRFSSPVIWRRVTG